MALGCFGKSIVFETSDQKLLTFRNFKRESEARWGTHDLINRKPMLQFLGTGTDQVSMEIVLDARHGVKPRKIIDAIRKCMSKGTAELLIIKGVPVGSHKYVINKMTDSWDEVWNRGELVRATLQLTFLEYPMRW